MTTAANAVPAKQMGRFERNLTWWVFGCIAAGIALGQLFPASFQVVGNLKLAEVNLPVATLVWLMLAVPILIQVFVNSTLAYWLNRRLGVSHSVACPSALIGASNFFELAVATAISLFGFESGAALATVVGVLIEVPVMLLVVRFVTRTKHWYELPAASR